MAIETKPFDSTEYLRDPESRAEFLRDALETGDAAFITHAKDMIARAAAAQSDLDGSVIAQVLEAGLLARYGRHDPEGLSWARRAIREELLRRGWTLAPYTYPDDD